MLTTFSLLQFKFLSYNIIINIIYLPLHYSSIYREGQVYIIILLYIVCNYDELTLVTLETIYLVCHFICSSYVYIAAEFQAHPSTQDPWLNSIIASVYTLIGIHNVYSHGLYSSDLWRPLKFCMLSSCIL